MSTQVKVLTRVRHNKHMVAGGRGRFCGASAACANSLKVASLAPPTAAAAHVQRVMPQRPNWNHLRLKPLDSDYLLRVLDLNPDLRARLELFRRTGTPLPIADCEELRELCGSRLADIGFDADDRPTPEGLRLEELIDLLYTE